VFDVCGSRFTEAPKQLASASSSSGSCSRHNSLLT
jgi:hypothetical protein